MSDNNIEIQIDNDSNKWINWIKEAISKKHIKYYEYKHFRNIEKIGKGAFGKAYRANWKSSKQYLVLKSFHNFDNTTIKEIVHELELQREVDFHNNVIRLYGITEKESQSSHLKKYLLVMEYADGSSLRNYLKENFKNLTWEDKYKLAYQLACAVLCLHDEGIVHRDLHSSNVLVNQSTVKLADFGLSKRIEEVSKQRSDFYGVVPYIDPKKFDDSLTYSLDKKSDVYSVGVLLWEISSGHPPFKSEFRASLPYRILQGLREKVIPNTPDDYAKIYTECWNNDPNDRPDIGQVASELHKIIIKTKSNEKQFLNVLNNVRACSSGASDGISQMIAIPNINEKKDLNILIDELVNLIFKKENEGKEEKMIQQYVLDYIINHKLSSQKVYNWLSKNQNNNNSICLFGYFSYHGIETHIDKQEAFDLFQNVSQKVSNSENNVFRLYLVRMYLYGEGVEVDHDKAYELSKKSADLGNAYGINILGCCYETGIGTEVNKQKAFELFQKATDLGNSRGMNNLGRCYENGIGTNTDKQKAFELYQKATDLGNSNGTHNLGHCFENGIGAEVNKQKAFELYKEAADLENLYGIINLGCCYEKGIGIDVDEQKAFKLYQKAADLGCSDGMNNLGTCYKYGIGTDVNKQKALELFQKAADLRNDAARQNLALMLKEIKNHE